MCASVSISRMLLNSGGSFCALAFALASDQMNTCILIGYQANVVAEAGFTLTTFDLSQVNIRLDQTVAELKKQLTSVVRLSTNSMRLYYIDKSSAFGPEEMKYSTRVLHSYGIQDGDELMVVPKTK